MRIKKYFKEWKNVKRNDIHIKSKILILFLFLFLCGCDINETDGYILGEEYLANDGSSLIESKLIAKTNDCLLFYDEIEWIRLCGDYRYFRNNVFQINGGVKILSGYEEVAKAHILSH